jgi:uncharacterized membrane protein
MADTSATPSSESTTAGLFAALGTGVAIASSIWLGPLGMLGAVLLSGIGATIALRHVNKRNKTERSGAPPLPEPIQRA